MKHYSYLFLLLFAGTLSACTKSPADVLLGDAHPGTGSGSSPSNEGLSDNFFDVSATVSNFNNTSPKVMESRSRISLPINKRVTFNVSTFFREIKEVSWKVNGNSIGSGNDLETTLKTMGVGTLTVEFTEVISGRKHNKQIKLYAFQQMLLSVAITPKTKVCGSTAIGVGQTLGSFNNEKIEQSYIAASVQNICSGSTNNNAKIARIPINVYDKNTTFTLDLIEPKEIENDAKLKFCLLFFCTSIDLSSKTIVPLQVYQTDSFTPALTANLTPGTYQSGTTILTLE